MSIVISPRAIGETADSLPPEVNDTGLRRFSIFASAPGDAMRDGGIVPLELAFETLDYARLGSGEGEPGDCVMLRASRLQLHSPYSAWMSDQVDPPDSGDELSTYSDWLKTPENEEQGAHVETFRNLQRGFASIDFENRHVLVDGGYPPSFAEPKFVAQMVFGVVTTVKSNFERALGREIITGLDRTDGGRPGVLTLNPWSSMEAQAWYDRRVNTLNFGLYESRSDAHGYSQGSIVFTGLSHDVVVHELCHALLDSVRPNLMLPVNMDVAAFHEAFCDIVAVLQRFSYPDLVIGELRNEKGEISGSNMLNTLARSFAETAGHGPTVRDIVGTDTYDTAPADPHGRSEVLVQAIYRAFLNVAKGRIANVISLASNGTGMLPEGNLPESLLKAMSRQVRKTAQMFQMMLIRALDYSPPVGIEFFDVLQSVLAADRELVPNDDSGVRRAWIDAFRESGIFAPSSEYYSEESLVAEVEIEPSEKLTLSALSFGETRFRSSPGKPLALGPATEQIREVVEELRAAHWLDAIFGKDAKNSKITLISLRSFARPGPSGMTQFGTSIELLREPLDGLSSRFGPLAIDGVTLVFDSEGHLTARCRRRYDDAHLAWSRQYAESSAGKAFWTIKDDEFTVRSNYQRRMCML
ncbi:hypothetical protein [Pontixanthobacter sp. CEM42]|uniref:hypothetical protein n=1 Tax=Pontixanthobacter sp. CEM42 TaxID=2792077 RepID=UPI001ADFD381|nr:hypothetical protein [Pontixanthobacter sp. CEM42]